MAVTRAPKRTAPAPEPDERRVQEVILKGGSVAADRKVVAHPITDPQKNVQLRLYQSILEEIDTLRAEKAGGRRPQSRHAWIVAAIEEKLARERQK